MNNSPSQQLNILQSFIINCQGAKLLFCELLD